MYPLLPQDMRFVPTHESPGTAALEQTGRSFFGPGTAILDPFATFDDRLARAASPHVRAAYARTMPDA